MQEITDKPLIENFRKELRVDLHDLKQSIKDLCQTRGININGFKESKLHIQIQISTIYLHILFSLWEEKQSEFQSVDPNDRKKLFDEVINLCSEIYPHIVNITCQPVILSSPLEHKNITIKNLSVISDSDTFIQALKKEQDYAFEASSIKRDNIIHQLRVFLLGQYFLSKYEKIVEWLWEGLYSSFPPTRFFLEEKLKKDEKKKIILGVWALTSLFHDCGRAIESFYKNLLGLKECFEEIFGIFNLDMPTINKDIELNELWKKKKKSFLKLLEYFLDRGKKYKYYGEIKSLLERAIENSKHGVISALLITYPDGWPLVSELLREDTQLSTDIEKTDEGTDISTFKQTKIIAGKVPKFIEEEEVISKVILSFYSALAIAFHDIEEYWFLTPLTQFLTLCDNLQEWNRLTKLGDQSIMIFPCEKIQLVDVERNGDLRIKVFIDYKRPERDKPKLEQEIFKRWEPKKRWPDFKEKIEKIKTEKEGLFDSFYKKCLSVNIKVTYYKNGGDKAKPIDISIPPDSK